MKISVLTYNFLKIKYLGLFFFGMFIQLNAQEASNSVDTTSIKIGEQINYKIKIKLDSLDQINFPKAKDFSPFELINEFKVDTNYLDKKFIISKQFALTFFDSGTYYIPSQKLNLLNKEIELDSFKITINDVKIDTTKQGLYDIKPIMKSNTQFDFLFWVSILMFIIIICIFLYFKNQILSFFTIQKLEVEYLTPYEKAVSELSKIKKLNNLSELDIKTYYSNLTFVIRNFIEEKIIDNALECTTKELIQKLSLLKTSKKLKRTIIQISEDQFERLFEYNEETPVLIYEDEFGSIENTKFEYDLGLLNEAEYQGRKVQLGKIMQGDVKKSKVYVKNDKGKVVKVNFGFGGKSAKGKRMVIKKNNPERRKSFRARMRCDNPGPKWKPRYWACRTW